MGFFDKLKIGAEKEPAKEEKKAKKETAPKPTGKVKSAKKTEKEEIKISKIFIKTF